MPASPVLAPKGRVRRLVAGVCTSALVALTLTTSARGADRELTVSAGTPATWEGRTALTLGLLFDPATLTPCGATIADVCDTTLVHLDGAGTLSVTTAGVDAGTPDVDLYVYRSDALGFAGPLAAVSAGAGPDEAVNLPAATGTYLVAAVSFSAGSSRFAGSAALSSRSAVVPDIDRPRGRQEVLVSDIAAGAASQPAIAMRDDRLVAAYRVFPDRDAYASRIHTSVSFDGGRSWDALGPASDQAGANPAVTFTSGHAVLLTNENSAVVLRRWLRPAPGDLRRGTTWEAPVALSAPPQGAVDERPVLAGGRGELLACWIRTFDLGSYGRQAVLCRHSADAGATWDAVEQRSPASVPGVPYGPYVSGVAVAGARGEFSVAWVDTLAGQLDGTGLDAAWVARGDAAPARAARFRPLPEHFDGDGFRNVPLLSLAAARGRNYLAFAAWVDGQADVQLVRSDGAEWSTPATVGAGIGGQFQPSVAARGRSVHVSFLDRRLDPVFTDEWLASSEDGGVTWEEQRLSHDSWDPAIGAPHSPTGDLLGDHQALVADRCGAVALAADPHLANAGRRDPDFDHRTRRSAVPQLFAWDVRDRTCA